MLDNDCPFVKSGLYCKPRGSFPTIRWYALLFHGPTTSLMAFVLRSVHAFSNTGVMVLAAQCTTDVVSDALILSIGCP